MIYKVEVEKMGKKNSIIARNQSAKEAQYL
jgi:hypothetical protein